MHRARQFLGACRASCGAGWLGRGAVGALQGASGSQGATQLVQQPHRLIQPLVRGLWGRSLLPPVAQASCGAWGASSSWGCATESTNVVLVENNNVDWAFKKLKRKIIDSGLAKELRERTAFVRPHDVRVRPSAVAKVKINLLLRCIHFIFFLG